MSEAKEMYCVKCDCIESAEEMVYVASEDAYYCRDCAESNGLVQCEHCGSWHRDTDLEIVQTANGEEAWCRSCISGDAFNCEHCGEYYSSEDFESASVDSDGYDETWCERCVEDDAISCWYCGDYVDSEYAISIDGGSYYICPTCAERYYERCDNCGEWFDPDDIYHSCGNQVCRDCAEDSYSWHWCEECGNYVYEDEWDEDMECCTNCIRVSRRSDNARVRSYHGDEPPMKYFGKYGEVFKGLGIELEIDRDYNGSASEKQTCLNDLDELIGTHAYFKYDGSLRDGIEIVTFPHTLEAFYELPWEKVLKACKDNGFSSHDIGTCGLHVHISREIFGDDEEMQSDNIAKLMQFYNIFWADILKISRRTDSQVAQWASKYPTIRKSTLKKWATKKDRYGRRYMAVNVTNDHTVEIRINRGTLNLSTFLATIDFVMTTAINSTKIGWADMSDDYQWLHGLKIGTLDYLAEKCAFYEPVFKYREDYWREENERRRAEERERLLNAEIPVMSDTVSVRNYAPITPQSSTVSYGLQSDYVGCDEFVAMLDALNSPF